MLVTVFRPDMLKMPRGAAAASVVAPLKPAASIACAVALTSVLCRIWSRFVESCASSTLNLVRHTTVFARSATAPKVGSPSVSDAFSPCQRTVGSAVRRASVTVPASIGTVRAPACESTIAERRRSIHSEARMPLTV